MILINLKNKLIQYFILIASFAVRFKGEHQMPIKQGSFE